MKKFLMLTETFYQKIPTFLIALGVLIRVKEWLSNRSLWLDEAYLGLTLLKQDWPEILSNARLSADFPVPPMGFMLVEKISITLFGNNELALRLFPLLCGIAAIFLFYALAKHLLSFPVAVAALSLFLFNDVVIEYCCELKQYSTDLCVLLALGALVVFQTDKDFAIKKKSSFLFSVAGMAAITLSHPAIFVLASFGVVQQIRLISQKRFRDASVGMMCGAFWLIVFMVWYYNSYASMSMESRLITCVKTAGYMRNVPLFSFLGLGWMAEKIIDIFGNVAMLRPVALSAPLFFLGVPIFFKKNFKIAAMLVFPLALAFIAGAGGWYLLGGRFSLFMVPAILLCGATTADFLMDRLGKKGGVLAAVCGIILLSGMAPLTIKNVLQPRTKQETRDFARVVQAEFREGDLLVVNSSGYLAMWFYFGQNGGFQIPVNYIVSDKIFQNAEGVDLVLVTKKHVFFDEKGCFHGFLMQAKKDPQILTADRDVFSKGVRRVWFFGGHLKGVEAFFPAYFAKRGIQPTLNVKKPGAALMLFEMPWGEGSKRQEIGG